MTVGDLVEGSRKGKEDHDVENGHDGEGGDGEVGDSSARKERKGWEG